MKRLILILVGLTFAFEVGAQHKYTLTEFERPQGARTVLPTDINDKGEVTGAVVYDNGRERPFRWTAATGLRILNKNFNGWASINNQGLITGTYYKPYVHHSRAFIWHPDGQFEDLGVPAGEEDSNGRAISDAGVVIGGEYRWIRGLGWQDFDRETGAPARAINKHGDIVGSLGVNYFTSHAFLWTEQGGMEDIGTLPVFRRPPWTYMTYPHALNNVGQVVGSAEMQSPERDRLVDCRAFIWSREEGMRDIGRLGNSDDPWNEARSINERSEVVGASDGRAFYWTKTSGMLDLNNLVIKNGSRLKLSWAAAINNSGEIVVWGYKPGSAYRSGFLLQPIR